MKKLLAMVLALALLCSLAGCGAVYEMTLAEDGAVHVNRARGYYNEAEVQMLEEMGGDISELGQESYRGQEYYVYEEEDYEDMNYTAALNANGAYLVIEQSESDLTGIEFYEVIVHYPRVVVRANGEIGEDKTTVTYDMMNLSDDMFWAAFTEEALNVTSAKLSGVKDGGMYKKAVKLELTTEGIFRGAKLTLKNENGTETSNATTSVDAYVEGDYTYTYTIGNEESSIRFTVDMTKPETNIANGKTYAAGKKITFSDNWSGIKSAKLDGKTIKSGKKVTAKGSHTLKLVDKCGNSKTVKFKIK